MIFRLEISTDQGVHRYFLRIKKLIFKRTPGSHDAFPTHSTTVGLGMARCLTMGWQADPKMYCSIYTWLIPRSNTKKINIFYSDPLPDLRPDLEAFGYSAFAYMFGFRKFQIITELWCLVVWSALGLDYYAMMHNSPTDGMFQNPFSFESIDLTKLNY
jgi:hypothetical protein